MDDAKVSIFGRSVTIRGVTLKPDVSHPDNNPQEVQLDLSIDGLFASGLNLKMLRGDAPFKLKTLEIDRPLITADIYSGKQKEATADSSGVIQKKPFDFPTRRLVVSDGNIILRQHTGGGETYTEADDINVDIRERNSKNGTGIAAMFEGGGTVSAIIMTNADASVDTIIDSLSLQLTDGNVSIAGVTVTPRYPREQFVYKSSRHRDWTHLWARNIEFHGVDVSAAGISSPAGGGSDKKMHVSVDSIHIGSGLVESYKDRNAYQPYWVRKLIFESVSRLPIYLTVGKAVVADMDAVYSELPKGGTTAGVINFTKLAGTVAGLSNIPSSDDPYWTLAAHGLIYGAASVNATFYFPKSESTDRFKVRGSLGSLDLTRLNKTITPLAKAEVEKGVVDKMDFHIVGNRHTASVDMELLYHDLKVELVKLKADNEVKERKFISWIANEFVIKESNPSGGEMRRGTGTVERELDRSQFNFLWKALMQGIKESAGL
ncbi:MAG: hypothetical protein LIO77_01735 [Rikenellaceae bacterium]|nr:hypothetical protein [Rikenellaceae bacterium]